MTIATASVHPGVTGHVVLAEDDDRLRQLLARALERDGFRVSEVCDGAALLDLVGDLLASGLEHAGIDLVITDVRMPILNGISALSALRSEAIPVIVMTAFGDAETHAAASRMGAVLVFDKPFDLAEIRRAARRAVSSSRDRTRR